MGGYFFWPSPVNPICFFRNFTKHTIDSVVDEDYKNVVKLKISAIFNNLRIIFLFQRLSFNDLYLKILFINTMSYYFVASGVASSISEGDIFIYLCSAQLTSFEIDLISSYRAGDATGCSTSSEALP